ncbi:flagellar motor switch protein FliG [Escherichia coli]|uniref:Flagellar motor switch protein FliG n=12 Tax=root TaxID=1 RepID=A0A484X5N9_ECOLX|nr:flagellar motor switch protein FliG [Escherichia coli]
MSNLTGTDKSVILLMTIGEDRAAEVFKHLSQREVQTLSAAMANVTQISNKQLTDVLAEFEQEAEQFAALNINANDYLRSVLVKALGEERAASLLEDILETHDTASGIETLNFMEPQSAADLIRDEHPQIIATILVHLKRAQAADILALFDERLRHDVMLRIATFGGVQPAALAELTEVLNGLLDGQNLKRSKMGGVRTAAEIINLMKTQQEEAVITAVREFDGELAQKIIDEMFLFENLVDVDDRSIQRLLQEVDSESLLIALKGAEQPLREKFLRNMSQRAADILRDDLANRGPVRLSQVENEQKAILLIVRRLAETGEMVIGSGEDNLCLIICRGKPGCRTISRHHRRSLCQWSSRKKPSLKRPNPALSSNWRNCKCRPTSKVIRRGLPKVASKVMSRAIRKAWPRGWNKVWQRRSLNKRQFMPGCSNWSANFKLPLMRLIV